MDFESSGFCDNFFTAKITMSIVRATITFQAGFQANTSETIIGFLYDILITLWYHISTDKQH